MNSDINLLHTTRKRASPVVDKRVKIFRSISIAFLFLVGAVSAGLFLLSIFSPLPGLIKEEQALTAEFNSAAVRKKTDSYFLTKVRSEDITKLLKSRSARLKIYNFISNLSSDSLTITALKLDKSGSVMTATSANLSEIERIIPELKKLTIADKSVDFIEISEISFDSVSGEYKVNINITQKVGAEKV